MLNLRRLAPFASHLLHNRCNAAAAAATKAPAPANPSVTFKRATKNPPSLANPLITCKQKRFNLEAGTKTLPSVVPKFGTIELASAGWKHHKAKGDFFTIHPSVDIVTIGSDETTAAVDDEPLTFDTFNLDERLLANLSALLATRDCSAIQARALPQILTGNHTLIAAETGCGKTLAYLVPIVQQLVQRKKELAMLHSVGVDVDSEFNAPRALVLTPGRELATQIGEVAEQLCAGLDLNVAVLLGGHTKQLMLRAGFAEVDILVGTMGATSKLATTGVYRMHQCEHVVLDEADTLLDDSFNAKLVHFLKRFPFHRNHLADRQFGTQLVLAAATMPTDVAALLETVVDPSTVHSVLGGQLHRVQANLEQRFVRMNKTGRPVELLRLVKGELQRRRPVIVFSNKSATSDYVSMFLNENGIGCVNLNGDMPADLRVGKFEAFQRGEVDVLSTTDMASRGLDTTRARHVVNFDVPLHISDYIHRIGRTGRLGSEAGAATATDRSLVTNFVSSDREIDLVQRIEHAVRTRAVLGNVNANITNIIKTKIMREMSEEL